MISARFGLGIGSSGPIGHAVGHNRASGCTAFRVSPARSGSPRIDQLARRQDRALPWRLGTATARTRCSSRSLRRMSAQRPQPMWSRGASRASERAREVVAGDWYATIARWRIWSRSRHSAVTGVELARSRSRGTHEELSDWEFAVETSDFDAFAHDLPTLVAPWCFGAQGAGERGAAEGSGSTTGSDKPSRRPAS
jgi:hypothetical protein